MDTNFIQILLGKQRLFPKRVLAGDTVDYSSQKEFGDTLTVFTVEKNGSPASTSDYIINDGIITFKTAGQYTVTMTNAGISATEQWFAEVIAEIEVVLPNVNATLSNISLSEGELNPVFDSTILHYTVCVNKELGEIGITATPSDPNANVSGDIGWCMLTQDTTVFTITVTAEDGVTTQDYTVMVVYCNVGIVETHCNASLRVYPNPTTGQLTIENGELTMENVEIYNIVGQKLQSKIENLGLQSKIEIDVSHLSNGLYFLKIDGKTVKFIKK